MLLNIFIVLSTLLIAYYFANKKFTLFTVLFFVFYQYVWMSISILIIENNGYISEQMRYGYFIYANVYLFLFYITSILSFVFFYQLFYKKIGIKLPRFKFNKTPESKLIYYLLLILLFIAYLNYFLSPNLLNNNSVTKFNFWKTAKFPFLSSVLGNVMGYVAFGAGLVLATHKKRGIFLIVLYFVYIILIGQKFSGLILGSYAILLAYYHLKKIKFNIKLKYIFNKYILITVIVLFGLIHNEYSKKNPYRHLDLSPTEAIFYRTFNLQGHLFWGVSEKYIHRETTKTYNLSELKEGMHTLMYEFYPKTHLKYLPSVIERGVSWTNAYPSLLLKIFPLPLALLFHFIIFALIPFFFMLLIKMIESGNLFFSIIFFQLITWINNAYIMGYFGRLIKVFIILFVMLLAIFIYKKYTEYKLLKDEN